MNAARTNARELAEEARLLFDAGRFPRAASLAILSIEESGKLSILRELILARSDEELARSWKSYRSHSKKNVSWIMPDLVRSGARTLDDLRPMFDPSSDHPQMLDAVKQIGFYSDCLAEGHRSIPSQVMDVSLARNPVESAEIFSRGREISVAEMNLWVEHLAPVWMGPIDWMKNALIKLNIELQKLGIDYGENWDRFVMGPAIQDSDNPEEST